MARQRMIRPEVRTSRTVCQWSREVRLAWIYLWMYLDNYGYGEDELGLIRADCFPRDRDVTEKKLDQWLTLIATTKIDDEDQPPLCRYEVRGRRYLHAVNWDNHQKLQHPGKRVYPLCPIHGYDDREHEQPASFRKPSEHVPKPDRKASHPLPPEVEEEKEVEDKELEEEGAGRAALFDEFWNVYPRKVGKADARRRFAALVKGGEDPRAIIGAARGYAKQVHGKDQQYVAHPATWLHQGRYEDEVPEPAPARPVGWEFG